jgi:hypothetical protein
MKRTLINPHHQLLAPDAPECFYQRKTARIFPSIDSVTALGLPTDQAAYYLNRQPQTLRKWASSENGPIRPTRINGRLYWPTAELKRLCRGEK